MSGVHRVPHRDPGAARAFCHAEGLARSRWLGTSRSDGGRRAPGAGRCSSMVAYRPGAATSIEVTGQSGQPKSGSHTALVALRPGPEQHGSEPAAEEPARATAAGGPERTRMAGVYQALDRDSHLAGSLTCVHEGP